jgi:hypothetical protein
MVWMVILDKLSNWNDTMFISLDFFIDVIGLELNENLDDSSLHSSLGHERFIVWSSKSFFSNFDFLNWLHAISNLLLLFSHELSFLISFSWLVIFENKNITFLSKINSIKNFNTWNSRVKIVMEMRDILVCKLSKLFYFQISGDSFL